LGKRQFTIQTNQERIPVEGQTHRNVAIKYLMKRRRSLLMTRDIQKVETLYSNLPRTVKIIGKQITRSYTVNWQRHGVEDYEGSRFVFMIHEENRDLEHY
jgi:predicted NAD-dependent protein-ADP-ribosyltransferase YbiA (DUF1768 family)